MCGFFDYMCYYDVVFSFFLDLELVEVFGGNQSCLDEEFKVYKVVIFVWFLFF